MEHGMMAEQRGGRYAPMPAKTLGHWAGESVAPLDQTLGHWAGPVGAMGPQMQFSLGMLLRRKWSILLMFILTAGVSIPAIWLLLEPKYQSQATVQVRPVVPRLLYKYEDNGLVPLYQSYLETQVALIRNPVILERVLDDREVQESSWFKNPPSRPLREPLPPLQRLMMDLSAAPRRGTELIDIAMSAMAPQDAKLIVDKVVSHYLNYADSNTEKVDQMQLSVLSDKQNELRNSIEGMIRTRNVIVSHLGTAEPDEIRSRVARRLVELEEERTKLEMDRDLNKWRLDYLQEAAAQSSQEVAAGDDQPRPAVDRFKARYEDDSIWQQRRLAHETAIHQLSLARDHFGQEHPRIRQLTSDVEHAQKLLATREAELNDPRATPIPAAVAGAGMTPGQPQVYDETTIARAIAEAEFRQQQIEQAIEAQRVQVDDVNQKAQTIERLNLEITSARTELEDVQNRLNVLRMEKKATRELGRVSLAYGAVMPAEPHRDRRALLTVLMLGFAMAAGVGFAFLRCMLDSSVREARDVRGAGHIPFLGYVPKVRRPSDLLDESDGPLHESIRMVRTALLDRVSARGGCSVVVTSPGPQAGKTSVAILLAKSLMRVGKKVLLVDADLRRSSLCSRLGIKAKNGLSDLLGGRAKDDEVIVRGTDGGIDILPAGESAGKDDAELMANGVFAECLRRWRQRYDFVLFDAPPVLPVADARILASQVDGAIMTLRAAHCQRSEAVEAIEQIVAAGGRTLGTVLVGTERNLGYSGAGYY